MRLFLTFWYKAKAAVLVTQWPLASGHTGLKELDASLARYACNRQSAFSYFLHRKQSKAIVYSTSQHRWSQSLLQNDYTSEKSELVIVMPLFERKKKDQINEFIKEKNRSIEAKQRTTLLLLSMSLPFKIFQHAAIASSAIFYQKR